jgi:hypothetical protein
MEHSTAVAPIGRKPLLDQGLITPATSPKSVHPSTTFPARQKIKSGRKLKPGEPGTIKLLAEYGEKLVCVRYRYDAENKRRIKTVELVIEERPWEANPQKIPSNKIMRLRITYGEFALREQVKAAGGKWNLQKQVWELPYQAVLKLGLAGRIITEDRKSPTAGR